MDMSSLFPPVAWQGNSLKNTGVDRGKNCGVNVKSNWNWKRPENIYFLISLFFGILLVFITPPYQIPDERAHFYRANQIAEGEFFYPEGEIMSSVIDFTAEIYKFDLNFKPQNKISKITLVEELFRSLDKDTKVVFTDTKTNNYSAINYFPQAVGIVIGKILKFSPYKLVLVSRIINLLVGIFLTTAAITISPIRKWSFVFIGLLPMALYQYASISPDAFVISLCIFYLALVLYMQTQDKTEVKMLALAIVITLSMALTKPGYVFLCFLILLVPIIRGKKKYDFFIKGVIILATLTLFVVWFSFSINNTPDIDPLVKGMDQKAQLEFVMNNPLGFVQTLANDLITDFGYITEMFIGKFGWLDTRLPNYFYWVYSIALIAVFLFDNNYEGRLTTGSRVLLLATFALIFLGTYTTFYIIFTPVGANYISGFQGRYLLPIIGLLFISGYNKHKLFSFKKIYLLLPIWAIGGFTTLVTVINRYYVTASIFKLLDK